MSDAATTPEAPPPAARATKNKLAVALSAEQLGALFTRLAGEPGLTIKRIQEIAREEYDISIGLESANEFLDKEFRRWCDKLTRRAQLAAALNARSDGNEAGTIARQADAELQQMVFESLMSVDAIDVTDSDQLGTADTLSKIFSRARLADDRLMKLQAELDAMKAQREAAAKELQKLNEPATANDTARRQAVLDEVDRIMGLKK